MTRGPSATICAVDQHTKRAYLDDSMIESGYGREKGRGHSKFMECHMRGKVRDSTWREIARRGGYPPGGSIAMNRLSCDDDPFVSSNTSVTSTTTKQDLVRNPG